MRQSIISRDLSRVKVAEDRPPLFEFERSEGNDRNGRRGGPPETRVGPNVLVSGGGGPCRNFCEILSQNRVERDADRMSAERCYRALRRRRTGEFAARAAVCVCARDRLRSALVWSRASARVRVRTGGRVWVDVCTGKQLCACTPVEVRDGSRGVV